MRPRRPYTEKEVRTLLEQAIKKAGSQKNFADSHNVARSYLSDVLTGKRQIAGKLLTVLGFEVTRTFYKRNGTKPT